MNLERMRAFAINATEQSFTAKDCMLYALGLGYGSSPQDPHQLRFVYEQGSTPLEVVPSYCVVLAHPGFWIRAPELEVNWVKMLHVEQRFELHQPLAPEGRVRGEYAIDAVDDRGAEKGAVVHFSKKLFDVASSALLATVSSTLLCRGDGGCGSFGTIPTPAPPLPADAKADCEHSVSTLPQGALLYRLNGDYNPLHVDPAAAEKAGLGKPILHGLCTMGLATRSAIEAVAGGEPARLRSMSVRFSKPVYPGETIRTELFRNGADIGFRSRAVERDVVVLDRGTIGLNDESEKGESEKRWPSQIC